MALGAGTSAGDIPVWDAVNSAWESQAALPVINVKMAPYNAVGDGSTNDTTAVQGAITAAAASGGVVFFPPGNYSCSPLTLPPGTVLQGVNGQLYYNATTTVPNSANLSRITLRAASTGPLISPDDTGTNIATAVRIRDLCFDNNAIAQKTLDIPDRVSSISRFWLIERCYFVNNGQTNGYAVYIGNLNTACMMRECVMFNGTSGSAAGDNGVGWYGSDGVMENCWIGYFADTGLIVLGGASDIYFQMRGGGIFTCTTGVVVAGCGAVFEGVSIDHNFNDGAYVGYPCSFIGCWFHTNSRTTNNTWDDLKVNVGNTQCNAIACRFTPHSGETSNHVRYHIYGATTSGYVTIVGAQYAEAAATANTNCT